MTSLITSDLHLDDKPQNEYRWGLLPWIGEQVSKYKIDEVLLLGDVTEAKDKHSAQLVNRLCDQLAVLSDKCKIKWLMGNHDCFDPRNPFFRFINNMPNLHYIHDPKIVELSIGKATFVPALTKWNFKLHETPWLFTHATFNGSVAENGSLLTGIDSNLLNHFAGRCVSGDVHVPQEIANGKITYVGAPYHIKFGDRFNPRVLILEHKDIDYCELYYPSPRKHTFVLTDSYQLKEVGGKVGDHVKIRCFLKRTDYVNWKQYKREIREIAEERGWVLFGVECKPIGENSLVSEIQTSSYLQPTDLVESYVKKHKLNEEYRLKGLELLK